MRESLSTNLENKESSVPVEPKTMPLLKPSSDYFWNFGEIFVFSPKVLNYSSGSPQVFQVQQ